MERKQPTLIDYARLFFGTESRSGGGWNGVRRRARGYLDATIEPKTAFDEAAQTVSYKILVAEGPQYHMGGWVITGLSTNGEQRVRATFPIASGDIFDKMKYQDFLLALQNHSKEILGDLPIHYENVGHWLKPDAAKKTVDVLLDFK